MLKIKGNNNSNVSDNNVVYCLFYFNNRNVMEINDKKEQSCHPL